MFADAPDPVAAGVPGRVRTLPGSPAGSGARPARPRAGLLSEYLGITKEIISSTESPQPGRGEIFGIIGNDLT